MKIKRGVFVIVLIAMFSICYGIMNQHYDELARYPHELNEEQRALVLKHLNTDEINALIAQKIEPNQFLPYIEIEGFQLENTLWYDEAYHQQKENMSRDFIVRFINKYKNQLVYSQLHNILNNYSFNALIRFFDEGDQYVRSAKLVPDPDNIYTIMNTRQTLYTYEPKDLVSVGTLPHDSILSDTYDVLVKAEVLQPLQELCAAAKEINGKTAGDMKIVAGYLSYENQIKLFAKAQEAYGTENFNAYWDFPGHSEFQLGYLVQLLPSEVQADVTDKAKNEELDSPSEAEREQEIWLKDNAYKYGFIIRYPKSGEDTTGKKYQPYTLRYVGKEMAKEIHNKNMILEEVDFSKYK